MAKYDSDPRAWALAELTGCCGCVIPTFTADVSALNEAAIRFDVQHHKALGMSAILIVSEGGATAAEYHQMIDICVDEAGDDLVTFVHAAQPTFAEMAQTIAHAEQAGVDLVLPSYPVHYHPESYDEIFEDTKRLADSTRLGIFIFAIDQWNFARLHPAGFPVDFLERLVEACPNIAGIKNEVGLPYAGGLTQIFERFAGAVLVTDPLEHNAPIWIRNYGMRFMGTSNYDSLGDSVPRMLTLLADPATWDEGMELYWQMTPSRRAGTAVASAAVALTSLVPRMVWKYQGWLLGGNGGPLRGPLPRINAAQMGQLRAAAKASGLPVTDEPDAAFFRGRTPGVMRLVDGDDVDALATGELGLAAARETADLVARGGVSTGRVQIGDQHAWMRILAGSLPGLDLTGYKEFHRVGKHVLYHVSLFRHSTGEPLGIVDGRRITSLRTASTAAIAFRHALGDEPLTLGVIGSGEEALEGLRAVAAAVPIERARVFSPTTANREGFAARMSAELGIEVAPAASVPETLAGADVAYVATAATSPVVAYEDIRHLRFVGAVGATRPDHHELSGDVVANAARVIVDCHDALEEPGDMRDALTFDWDPSTAVILGDWLTTPVGADAEGPLLFKSIGSVEQDLVLAHHLLKAAESRGLGRTVDPIGSLRVMR